MNSNRELEAITERLDQLRLRLHEEGHRVTPQRLAIAEAVMRSREHPTAQEVFEEVGGRFPTMSLATVYKTLGLLEEMGEVVVVAGDRDRAHYDSVVEPAHLHLVCTACGAIEDLEAPPLEKCLRPARESGWKVGQWRLELLGTCAWCAGR